jgi:hypothetical protein
LFHSDATIGPQHLDDPFYAETVRGPLTRNVGPRFLDIQDEVVVAFNDHIRLNGDGKFCHGLPSSELTRHRMGQRDGIYHSNGHCD